MGKLLLKAFLVSVFIVGLIASVYAQPANDLCANAIAVSVPSVTAGTTTGSTFDDVGFCGTSNTTGGVWYTVIGTGNQITATTCSASGGSADYDSKISVFSGDCGSLTCIGGNDDTCEAFRSSVTWNSDLGTVYSILVHGFSSATGNFNLAILGTVTEYDVYIKDNDTDDGSVPSSSPFTESPDIWIRNDGDCAQTGNQDLIPGIMTTVCVRLHNRLSSDINNITADVYWSDADQALSWPASWALIDSFTVTSLAGGTDTVGSVSWDVPRDVQQFGLLVRADASPEDPIGSGPDTTVPIDEVQNNNNITQRNVEILDPDSCIGQICYYSCTIGLCPASWCTVNIPGMTGCMDVGQTTYCGCTLPCPPSSCSVFIPSAP